MSDTVHQAIDEDNRKMEILEKGIKSIFSGNAILITGAGASYGAVNESGSNLPMGDKLAELIFEECEIPPSTDLNDAADTFIEKFGEDRFIGKLKKLLNVTEIREWHKILYSQNWRNIYTTNYDRVPVIACNLAGKNLVPVTLDASIQQYDKVNKCIYINGIIDNLNHNTLNSQFKLNSSSYESSAHFANSEWSSIFGDDVDAAEYVFIVGLSLEYDLDLKRTYRFNKINRGKTIIITAPLPEDASDRQKLRAEEQYRKLSRFGIVYQIGIQGFTKKIVEMRELQEPLLPTAYLFSCFKHYKAVRQSQEKPSPIDVYHLFVNGEFNPALLASKEGDYIDIVRRESLDNVLQLIYDNKKIIYIHSDFGNGKTIILEEISDSVSQKGIDVYVFQNDYPMRLQKDIDKICGNPSPKVVIIDTFNNYMGVLRKFSHKNHENTSFVLASRSGLMSSLRMEVDSQFSCKEGDSFIFDVNKLSRAELIKLSNIFINNGMWGELAAKNSRQRIDYLSRAKDGNSEFQAILLGLLDSSTIRKRLNEITASIKTGSTTHFKALLIILLSRMLTLDLMAGDLNELVGTNIVNDANFASNEGLSQLLRQRSSDGLFLAKSTVIAKVILHATSNINDVVDMLVQIAEYCIPKHELSRYYNILRNLISFSLVSTFIDGYEDRNNFMVIYYERLSQNRYYSKNHFFWLQFAMALIRIGEDTGNKDYYLRAKLYLDNALGLKPQKDFVPFQINNQKARLLLKMIMSGTSDNVKDDFMKAHELLKLPITSDKDNPILIVNMYKYYLLPDLEKNIVKAGLENLLLAYGRDAYNIINKLQKRMYGEDRQEAERIKEKFFYRFGLSN